MRSHSTLPGLIAAVAGSLFLTVACNQPSSSNSAPPPGAEPAAAPAAQPAPAQPASAPEQPAQAPATPPPSQAAPAPAQKPAAKPKAAAPEPAPPVAQSAPAPEPQPEVPPEPPAPPPPRIYTLKAGTTLRVWTTSALSTKSNQTGETFSATLAEPIEHDGWVIAEKGAHVRGVILESDPGGRVKDTASLAVTINCLTLADGRTVALVVDSVGQAAKSSKGKDAKRIGIATGVGAAIGAIAGGGKGAAIGAGIGGGAGAAHTMATRGEPAVIPAETELTFVLTEPITVKERR
jgi:hypothetical protein